MTDRLFSIAAAPRQATKVWPQLDPMTWSALVTWLDLDKPATQKDCGCYVLGELADQRRTKNTVVSRSVLVLDADHASPTFAADTMAAIPRCALATHTTWRHTPDHPRWRLLMPLSRDVTPLEYRRIAQALMVELGWEQFDPGSMEAERLMHRPSSQGSDYQQQTVIAGQPLDADLWLVRAKEHELDDEAPTPRPGCIDDSPVRDPMLGIHPYAEAVVTAELARLTGCDVIGWGGPMWDRTTFEVACNLVEIANSSWSGYGMDQAEADLLDHVPTDGPFGHKEHAAKWRSALRKVGSGGRRCPDGTAAEDFGAPLDVGPGQPEPSSILSRFPRTSMAELLDPTRPPREYVVEPMIAAGTAVALVAPAGHRKSLLVLGLALAVARGDEEFAGMVIPRARRVFYADLENTEDDLRERLLSFGVTPADDLARFILVSLPNMDPLDTAKGGADLLAVLDAYGVGRGDLVVLDSYQRVTAAGENDSDTTRGYYRHTGMHLKARGLTVIRTDNTGKDTTRGARGSSGKRDDVDVEYLLKSDGEYIEVTTGKVRQRGVTQLLLTITTDDAGRTSFRSDLPSPAWVRANECAALLDELGVPADAGERKALTALKEAGHDVPRAVVRDAVKVRQNRAAEARRAFTEDGVETPRREGAAR